jgi:hypothetical protein
MFGVCERATDMDLETSLDSQAKQRGARISLDEIPYRDFTHYEMGVSPTGVQYDEYVRAVHEACQQKSAANLGLSYHADLNQICASCVYSTTMPGVYLYKDGRCNMCHTYERALERDLQTGGMRAELEECLASAPASAGCDVIVALSGGKDSSAALAYVAQEKGLRVKAILADNGFIPDFVKENCQQMCDRVGAEFVTLPFSFHDEVKRALASPVPSNYPCNVCSKRFKNLIAEYAVNDGCQRVIMGRNFWATIEPNLSGVRDIRTSSGAMVRYYSLPFLLGWSLSDLTSRLDRVGWDQRARGIPGASTNCRVPGMVEAHYRKTTHLHPEAPLLANEVICGFITQQEALKELEGHSG